MSGKTWIHTPDHTHNCVEEAVSLFQEVSTSEVVVTFVKSWKRNGSCVLCTIDTSGKQGEMCIIMCCLWVCHRIVA